MKLVDSSRSFRSGYGAGSGEIIREEYKRPFGKGIVLYEKDDIPCFRETDIIVVIVKNATTSTIFEEVQQQK